jgi:hypothetical protein
MLDSPPMPSISPRHLTRPESWARPMPLGYQNINTSPAAMQTTNTGIIVSRMT